MSGSVTKLGIEYRKINGVLVKFYPQTAAEQVIFDSNSYENVATVKAALEELDARINNLVPLDALVFRGIIDGTTHVLPHWDNNLEEWVPNEPAVGHVYRVAAAGTYAGEVCEPGDMLTCVAVDIVAHTSEWVATQTNIDGAVVGPASAVTNHIAVFDGTSGKVIADGGMSIQGLKNYTDSAVATHDSEASDLATGHVKLSDSTSSSSDVNSGIAATPLAVKTVADDLAELAAVSWALYGTDASHADVSDLGEGGSYLEFAEDFWTPEPVEEVPPVVEPSQP